jgi:hypothetical protein
MNREVVLCLFRHPYPEKSEFAGENKKSNMGRSP